MIRLSSWFIAIAAFTIFAGLAGAQIVFGGGSGGPMICTALVGVPSMLRAEGTTELIGDIEMFCPGGLVPPAGTLVPTADFTIGLGANVTSRLLPGGGSEALLLIDEPGLDLPGPGPALPQTVCASTLGADAGGCIGTAPGAAGFYANISGSSAFASQCLAFTGGACTSFGATPNVFIGSAGGNTVTFTGIPVLPTAAGFARVFRVTNIRVDAALLPSLTTTVSASVLMNGSGAVPVLGGSSLIAGFVQNSLSTAVRNAANSSSLSSGGSLAFLQCNGVPQSGSTPVASAVVRFSTAPAFNQAFKTRLVPTATSTGIGPTNNVYAQNIPSSVYFSESGFVLAAQGGTAGLADYGTRLRAVFSGIPVGVNAYVTVTNLVGANTALNGSTATYSTALANGTLSPPIAFLVSTETASDSNGLAPTASPTTTLNSGALGLRQVSLTSGSGEAVWEVVQTDPASPETLDFGVYFSYAANAPPLGTGTVSLGYAPTPGTFSGFTGSAGANVSATLPLPRFVDTSTPANILTVSACPAVPALPGWGLALLAVLLAGSTAPGLRRSENRAG